MNTSNDRLVALVAKQKEEQSQPKSKNEQNKIQILKALKKIKAKQVEVSYSGSGDSGQVDSVRVFGAKNKELATNVKIPFITETQTFDKDKNQWVRHLQKVSMTLEKALEDLAYDSVYIHHAGWENNDGASGFVSIDVSKGTFSLQHTEYYTESNTYEHEL